MSLSELFFYCTGILFWLVVAAVLFLFAIGKLRVEKVTLDD